MYESIKCETNNLILILILTLTITDPVTAYFIRPLVNKLANRGRFVGRALPDLELFFATICSYVYVADKLSGPELKSGVRVGYSLVLGHVLVPLRL